MAGAGLQQLQGKLRLTAIVAFQTRINRVCLAFFQHHYAVGFPGRTYHWQVGFGGLHGQAEIDHIRIGPLANVEA